MEGQNFQDIANKSSWVGDGLLEVLNCELEILKAAKERATIGADSTTIDEEGSTGTEPSSPALTKNSTVE
jgi:hypothetical protein